MPPVSTGAGGNLSGLEVTQSIEWIDGDRVQIRTERAVRVELAVGLRSAGQAVGDVGCIGVSAFVDTRGASAVLNGVAADRFPQDGEVHLQGRGFRFLAGIGELGDYDG